MVSSFRVVQFPCSYHSPIVALRCLGHAATQGAAGLGLSGKEDKATNAAS